VFSTDLTTTARLAPLEVWHAEEFASHMDRAREHIRPWVGPSFLTGSVEQARVVLQRYATATAADGARLFGIWRNGQLCGGVMFTTFDPVSGVCELGCWLEPAAEGHGLVHTASQLLLEWAFEVRAMHRAEWRCRVDNVRSSRLAQRLNMTLDGILRQSWLFEGVHYDKQVWSILAADWRAQRESAGGSLATSELEGHGATRG
jgi:ribosomal-protein-serine acetyltransferase